MLELGGVSGGAEGLSMMVSRYLDACKLLFECQNMPLPFAGAGVEYLADRFTGMPESAD